MLYKMKKEQKKLIKKYIWSNQYIQNIIISI